MATDSPRVRSVGEPHEVSADPGTKDSVVPQGKPLPAANHSHANPLTDARAFAPETAIPTHPPAHVEHKEINALDRESTGPRLLALVEEVVRVFYPQRPKEKPIRLDSALEEELKLDSLARAELLARIGETFQRELPESLLVSASTPRDFLRALWTTESRDHPAAAQEAWMAPAVAPLGERSAENLPHQARTLVEVLRWHVEAHAEQVHVFWEGEQSLPPLRYGDLWRGAETLARGLAAMGVGPGQVVVLMLPTGVDYLEAFFGVLLAGASPAPIYPPTRAAQVADHLRRHADILANARSTALITLEQALPLAGMLKALAPTLRHVVTCAALRTSSQRPSPSKARARTQSSALPWQITEPRAEDIAHLQYTSGSTGQPKGVVLTHANLLANIRAMGQALEACADDVFVSWLPLYHDMGLIGAWLGSLYHGVPLVLMSPMYFLAHPRRWLEAIHRHHGTISGGPNFGYELCLHRIDSKQTQGLHLSSWRCAFNGAEPVLPATLSGFTERFRPCGFRAEAFSPVYGLAECAVGLAFPPLLRGAQIDRIDREALTLRGRADPAAADARNAIELPACGFPLPAHEIRVVNEAGQELDEREEGRVQFRGPSATSGYYRNPEATQELFHKGTEDWHNTGDLGYLAGGEIYITGRSKDLIVRAGRNIYPHELEQAIASLEGVRKGCVAVFGVSDAALGTERIVSVVETRFTEDSARRTLRESIAKLARDLLDAPLDEIVLASAHAVLKTSSGKIRRQETRRAYERGALGKQGALRQWMGLFASTGTPLLRRVRMRVSGGLYGAWALFWGWLIFPPVYAGVLLLPFGRWALVHHAARLWLRGCALSPQIHGAEWRPAAHASAVIVANHTSYLDALVLIAVLPHAVCFVAKRELASSWWSRIYLQRLGVVFVDRFDAREGARNAAQIVELARKGASLGFFPEGTFSRRAGLMAFRMGAFQAAAQAGTAVHPVVLRGLRTVLRDKHWVPRYVRISVRFLPPHKAAGTDSQAAAALRDETRRAILAHAGEPDLERRDPQAAMLPRSQEQN